MFGFVFWLPLAVLILILVFLLNNVEDFGRAILELFIPDKYLHYGFGIVLGLLIVYLSGVFLRLPRVRGFLSRVPVLGMLFGSGEMMTVDHLTHLTPCIFLLSPTCLAYGWILSEEKVKFKDLSSSINLIHVFYPAVPSLITGEVLPVRKEKAIRLGNSSKEIIDILLYSFRSPSDITYLPWEEESADDFTRRATAFGLDLNIHDG